jgi:lysine 6-dehydrogenase
MGAYRYGVIGAGRQGTAAAYDLVVRGDAEEVVLADADPEAAKSAAERVNALTDTETASPAVLDAGSLYDVSTFMEGLDAVIVAVPWRYIWSCTTAALGARTHMCDLSGGHDTLERQLALDDEARTRGVAIVPDCGEAPGLGNHVVAYAVSLLDEPRDVRYFDGGLPLHPEPPWNYRLTFSIEGVPLEYAGTTPWVRDGRLVEVEHLDPAETVMVDVGEPLGVLEAFSANAGGTLPRTIGATLRTFEARVLRYPGHVERMLALKDLGLFSDVPIEVGGERVVPRDVLKALLEPQIRADVDTIDIVIAHVEVAGRHAGAPTTATVQLRVIRPDDDLGFTAMERTTGWHAAMIAHGLAAGAIAPGVTLPELALDPGFVMDEARVRGFEVREEVVAR